MYVFTPEDLELLPEAVAGWLHDGREWLRRAFPPPQVIYDRALADDRRSQSAVETARRLLPGDVPLVCSRPLADAAADKWAVYRSLLDHQLLVPYLLETKLLAGGGREVAEACGRHGAVVVKDRLGHKALGVIYVARAAGGRFSVFWNPPPEALAAAPPGGELRREMETAPGPAPADARPAKTAAGLGPEETARLLDRLVRGREVVVQRAVTAGPARAASSVESDAPVEVRAIMHRTPPAGAGPDPPDRWMRTGMVCRMACRGLPFLALGHELDERPSVALPAALGSEVAAAAALDTIRRLSRSIARHMEERFGRGGELAVDFLVDGSGRPWFLEANTVPATLFRRTGAERLRRRAAERVLRYAAYLAAKGRAGPAAGKDATPPA